MMKNSHIHELSLDLTMQKKQLWLLGLFSIGIMLRYMAMSLGYNFDFESYCIVGEISGNFRNVYSETSRYNYAPFFMFIQGTLYKIAQIKPKYWELIYRVLIVTVLTLADLGIAGFIARRYSYKKALIFFINPISIIITGYHNQFDNIAVLFALLSTIFFNEDKDFNKKDIGFVALFSISLITKHILFILPVFILLMDKLPAKKKILYAFVPPLFFLLSFVPFALSSNEAFQGIVNNVFEYRSFNNAPLLQLFYNLIHFPDRPRIIVYEIMMITLAWKIRKLKFENIMLLYLIAMVSFSSAIANQYLAIPMAALCILNIWKWDKIYMTIVSLYLILQEEGFALFNIIQKHFSGNLIFFISKVYVKAGYILAAWILFFAIVQIIKSNSYTRVVIDDE